MAVHRLDHEQRRTLERVTGHPLPANLKSHQVLSLLEAVGDVKTETKDRYRVTVEERTEVYHLPPHGDVPADTVVKLRNFLESLTIEGEGPS